MTFCPGCCHIGYCTQKSKQIRQRRVWGLKTGTGAYCCYHLVVSSLPYFSYPRNILLPYLLIVLSSYYLTFLSSDPFYKIRIIATITRGVHSSRGYRLIIISPYFLIILSSYIILSYLIGTLTCGVDGSRGWGWCPIFYYFIVLSSFYLTILSHYPLILSYAILSYYLWC